MKKYIIEYEYAYDNHDDPYYNFELPVAIKEIEVVYNIQSGCFKDVNTGKLHSIYSVYDSKEKALISIGITEKLEEVKKCEDVIGLFKRFLEALR